MQQCARNSVPATVCHKPPAASLESKFYSRDFDMSTSSLAREIRASIESTSGQAGIDFNIRAQKLYTPLTPNS